MRNKTMMELRGQKVYKMEVYMVKGEDKEESIIIDMLYQHHKNERASILEVFDFFERRLRKYVPYKKLKSDSPGIRIIEASEDSVSLILEWHVSEKGYEVC